MPLEVLMSGIATRIEEWRRRTSLRIDSDNVRPFVGVAVVTREREVLLGGRSMMFDGNDVVDLKW